MSQFINKPYKAYVGLYQWEQYLITADIYQSQQHARIQHCIYV